MDITVEGLTFRYTGKPFIQNMCFQVKEGEIFGFLGPSGAGKSTLIRCINRMIDSTDGKILFDGQEISGASGKKLRLLRSQIGMVFQNYNLIDYLTPEENVMLGGKKDIEKILEAVGIPREDWKRQVLQLSGGQQQRVAIARALASPAKVLLADEPTGNLDEEIADEIIKILMKSAHEMGKSVIVVTHSKKIADAADVVLKIHEGKLYHLV